MKIIRLTESDLTNIVKTVIKENSLRQDLIQQIKEDGWEETSELVGGRVNLKKLVGIESPIDFLNLFNDLEVVQSEENPAVTLFRYEKGNNMISYNKNSDRAYIDYYVIWEFLEEGFGLNYTEIKDIIKYWLESTYNLRGTIPGLNLNVGLRLLESTYNLRGTIPNSHGKALGRSWRVPTI